MNAGLLKEPLEDVKCLSLEHISHIETFIKEKRSLCKYLVLFHDTRLNGSPSNDSRFMNN